MIRYYILGFALLLLPFLSVICRLIISHPYSFIRFSIFDFYRYIKYKKWRNCPYGSIKCYIAHRGTAFGTGKTLSVVSEVSKVYQKYNGVSVYDTRRNSWVTQRINVLSNVTFSNLPFEQLVSLSQFVQGTDQVDEFDRLHNTLTVTYVIIDEASSQLNSRSFKSNFDPTFISRLLTSRHVRANLILTSQRSGMVDKLMRDCTNYYISCQKLWRFEILRWYDAYQIETAQDPNTVPPIKRTGYFIQDKLFSAYDTYASVKQLEKSCAEGDMLSESEILALRSGEPLEAASSRRAARRNRKRKQGG